MPFSHTWKYLVGNRDHFKTQKIPRHEIDGYQINQKQNENKSILSKDPKAWGIILKIETNVQLNCLTETCLSKQDREKKAVFVALNQKPASQAWN